MTKGAPITIQKQDQRAEWSDLMTLHCIRVNKAPGSNPGEYFEAGAEHTASALVFEVRWSKRIEPIRFDTSSYRIVYRGHPFSIDGFDDFEERHETVKLRGVSYDG